MKFHKLSLVWALFWLLDPGIVLAVFDGQVMVGSRTMDMSSSGNLTSYSGVELQLAGHVDPLPAIPFSIGVNLNPTTYRGKIPGYAPTFDMNRLSAAVDVMTWLPLPIGFSPYARISLIAFGTLSVSGSVAGQAFEANYDLGGYSLALGVNYPFLPLLSFLAEYNISNESAETSTVKLGGTNTGKQSMNLEGTALLIGIELGL